MAFNIHYYEFCSPIAKKEFVLEICHTKLSTTLLHSNVLIALGSTSDPGIAAAVLIQNKPITKIVRLTFAVSYFNEN